jgi:hypothetical protein
MIVFQKLCSIPWGRRRGGGKFQSFIITTTGTVCTHPEGYEPMMLRDSRERRGDDLVGQILIAFLNTRNVTYGVNMRANLC